MKNTENTPLNEPPKDLNTLLIQIIQRDFENRMAKEDEVIKDHKLRNVTYIGVIIAMIVLYTVAVLFHALADPIQSIQASLYLITITLILFLGVIASEVVLFIKNIKRKKSNK